MKWVLQYYKQDPSQLPNWSFTWSALHRKIYGDIIGLSIMMVLIGAAGDGLLSLVQERLLGRGDRVGSVGDKLTTSYN